MKILSKKNNGQMLAEVLVAIGVIVLVLVGMTSLMTRSTKTVRETKMRDEAKRLIEGRLAYLRMERDRDQENYINNVAVNNMNCPWTFTSDYGSFSCAQMFSNITGGKRATVTASWSEGGEARSMSMSADIMQY